jgi:predicted transcriptional regulator
VCPTVVVLIYTIEDRAPETRIVIEVTIKTRKGERRVRILVDSGIEANYIKRRLALDMGIILILRATLLSLPEERRIHLYRDYIFGVITEDILGNQREADIQFVLYNFNLNYINIILGFL